MLELSMIQSTTRSNEAGAHSPENPTRKSGKDEVGQEFQSEYDSVEETKEKAEKTADTSEKSAEAATDEEATPEAETPSAHAETSEFDVTVAPVSEAEEFPNEIYALAATGDANSRATLKNNDALTGTENTQFKHSEATVLTMSGNGGSKPLEADGAVVIAKASALGTKTTAETVVMTKAAANAASLALATPAEGLVPSDRARSAVAEAVNSKNAPVSTTDIQKVDFSFSREGGRKKTADDLPRDVELRRDRSAQVPVQATAVPEVKPMMSQQLSLAKLPTLKEKTDIVSPVVAEPDSIGILNARSLDQLSTAALHQVLNRAETPTMIARQMVEALQKLPDRPVEISLNPKELGRVRMNISAAEAGITVSVVAERPETLDLMRRNIDQLTREFQALGYDTINFAFAEGEAKNSFGESTQEQSRGGVTHLEVLPEDEETDAPQRPMVATSGVDIRI